MSQLNQIIASILSDINEAKSKADFASRDLAQAYASDDILRYFPVPKIGISNLEVEIKYAVETVEEKPIESSQSQRRLADFIQKFSEQTANEIKNQVAKEVTSNVLYKDLGSNYPSQEWESNFAATLSDSLSKSVTSGADLIRNLPSVTEQLKKNTVEFFPLAFKSETVAAVPKSTGEYQVIGLDKSGAVDFKIQTDFPDDKTALNLAKSLNSAILSNKLELGEVKRDALSKTDMAKAKLGNQEIVLTMESQKVGSSQPKVFFESVIKEKSVVLNKPILVRPTWLGGRPIGAGTRPTSTPEPSVNLKEDDTLLGISQTILRNKLTDFRVGVEKILNESKVTSLKLTVESEKLKQVKPETVSTIKFTLTGNDFTMVQDDGQKSVL